MPRGPRKRSNTGIYHIMLRGSNKQRIFHDKTDFRKARCKSDFAASLSKVTAGVSAATYE